MFTKRILVTAGSLALAAGLAGGLAGCGSAAAPLAAAPASSTPAAPAPTKTVTASAPQVTINNNVNNNAPAVSRPVYVAPAAPAPVYVQADPWSVAAAYYTDINNGDNWDAWNMLSSSVQEGWNNNYDTYVANFTPLSFDNVTYVSESGDSVTFTFTLHNHNTGYYGFRTCTFTVDNGIIIWSS